VRYSPISARRVCRPLSAWSWDATFVESDWAVRREEEGTVDEEATSRSKCSTPISSASSASIEVGIWVNVRCVVVPSWYISLRKQQHDLAYISNLFYCKVGICGDTCISPSSCCPNVHNHHHRSWAESLEQFRDFQIGRTESGTSMVESDRALLR
jgi:hypothetical protein